VLSKVDELRADGHDVIIDAATHRRQPHSTVRRNPPPAPARRRGRRRVQSFEFERSMLAPVRAAGDLMIDTSDLNVHQLKDCFDLAFDAPTDSLVQVAVESFGFSQWSPLDPDIMVDVPFLPILIGRRTRRH